MFMGRRNPSTNTNYHQQRRGSYRIHFLAMLGAEEDYPYIDPSVGIEINVDEIIMESGKDKISGNLKFLWTKAQTMNFSMKRK